MPDPVLAPPPIPAAPTPIPAPTPTPAPASKPAPAARVEPTPTPTPEPTPQGDDGADPFAELDARVFGKKEPLPKPEPTPAPEPKPSDGPPGKAIAVPKQLREELERTKAEIKAKTESHSKLEQRIAELEAKGQDTTVLSERLATREKELETLQSELRAAKAEVSPEFKQAHDAPFNRAADRAKAMVERLQVTTGTDEATGEPKVRAATWEDFVMLYQLPEGQDILAAKRMFGEASSIVEHQLTRLKEMDYNRQQALADEKTSWKAKETAQAAEQVKQREAYTAATDQARKAMLEKHADWFDEIPGDDEGNGILKEGRRLLDAKPRTFQEAVALMTRNRLNAESAPRERWRNEKMKAEIEQLKATIEELKNGKPGPGRRPSSDSLPAGGDDELKELEGIFSR